MQRAIKLTQGKIERLGPGPLPQSEMRPGGYRRWWVDQERGYFVVKELDAETAYRLNSPIREQNLRRQALEQNMKDLEKKLTRARQDLARARRGLQSLFVSGQRREEMEMEVVRLEDKLSSCEFALRKVIQASETGEQGWCRVSFEASEDNRLWNKADGYFHIPRLDVYMRPSGFDKAQAFQKEEPIYLGTWFPKHSNKLEGKFWWHRDKFSISTMYSEEEARLFLWEKGRREERKLETLAKARAAAKEVREEAGRERIPEEVRLASMGAGWWPMRQVRER